MPPSLDIHVSASTLCCTDVKPCISTQNATNHKYLSYLGAWITMAFVYKVLLANYLLNLLNFSDGFFMVSINSISSILSLNRCVNINFNNTYTVVNQSGIKLRKQDL